MPPADPEIARLLATFPEPIAATAAQLVALLLIRLLPGAELPVDEIAILLAQAIALKA